MGSLVRDVWRRSLIVIFMVEFLMGEIGDRALCIKFNFNVIFSGCGDRFNRDCSTEI